MDYHGRVEVIVYYLVVINLIAFIAFALDKYKARKNKWRIPEKSLMTLAIVGGSVGSLLGIYIMRHKTQKKNFTVGIPVILIVQFVLILYLSLKSWGRFV